MAAGPLYHLTLFALTIVKIATVGLASWKREMLLTVCCVGEKLAGVARCFWIAHQYLISYTLPSERTERN